MLCQLNCGRHCCRAAGRRARPANEAARVIATRSPTAVAVTLEVVRRAAKLDILEEVLRQEYQASCSMMS